MDEDVKGVGGPGVAGPDVAGPGENKPRKRRRASRAAGPTGDGTTGSPATVHVSVSAADAPPRPAIRPAGPPRRRRSDTGRVARTALSGLAVASVLLGAVVVVLVKQERDAAADANLQQRFIDTAKQTVVNMFSYSQDSIDESVERFVAGTSGPLRDMMSGNAENLKMIFRETHASAETVINGAAWEGFDDVLDNASVLVASRVTVTDVDGVNKPSQPYRLRIIVHKDESGAMTAYDVKYPDGGN